MELKCKISLLGDQRVGKTSLIVRFIEDSFQSEYIATFGADFVEKQYNSDTLAGLKKGDTLNMVIWDLAGHSHFEQIAGFYLQGSAGIVLVYDVNNPESFQSLIKWKEFCDNLCPHAHVIVVGNKTDLEMNVKKEEIEALQKKLKVPFLMASAKLDDNVDNIFDSMAIKIVQTLKKT